MQRLVHVVDVFVAVFQHHQWSISRIIEVGNRRIEIRATKLAPFQHSAFKCVVCLKYLCLLG